MATHIRKLYDRIHNAAFNAKRFRQALLRVYDMLSVGKEPGQPVPLRQVHEVLILRDGPKGYTLFDIYRLRQGSLKLHSNLVNRFAEIIDLDYLWEVGGPDALYKLAEQILGQETDVIPSLKQALRDTVLKITKEHDMTVSPVKRTVETITALIRR